MHNIFNEKTFLNISVEEKFSSPDVPLSLNLTKPFMFIVGWLKVKNFQTLIQSQLHPGL